MNRITNNWNLKLTALVLAIALWTHVRGEVNPWETATFKVPLRFDRSDLPQKLIITDASKIPAVVNVTVRAPRLVLREMKGSGLPNPLAPPDEVTTAANGALRATLDFTGAHRGEQTIPIKIEPRNDLEVIGTNPGDIVVTLDQAAVNRFFVEPDFAPALKAAYTVQGARVEPATVEVSGPSNQLAKVARVQARIISVRAGGGLMTLQKVPLFACDSSGENVLGVRIEPEQATVGVNLREKRVARKLRVIPEPHGMPGRGYRFEAITVDPPRLEVNGPQRNFTTDMALPVPVDINGATAPVTRQVTLSPPEGLKFTGPARVTVRVRIVPDNLPAGGDLFPSDSPFALPGATPSPRPNILLLTPAPGAP